MSSNLKTSFDVPRIRQLFKILFTPTYGALAVCVAVIMLYVAIWLPNFSFLKHVLGSDLYSISSKANILWNSLWFLKTNFTLLTRTITIAVVVLTGVNMSVLVYYMRRRIAFDYGSGSGIIGTLSGFFGVGCASCGSVILSSIVGLGTSVSILGLFPLKGAEFGILGIVIIVFSINLILKKIQNPGICKIQS